MHERSCPICAANAGSRLFAESNYDPSRLDGYAYASRKTPEYMHHQLWLCQNCDLLYASPIPQSEEISEAYTSAQFDSQEQGVLAARTYSRLLKPILPQLPSRSGALDIGAGDGAFLMELSSLGFQDVHGVEPSAAPIAAADPQVRPLIRQGFFEKGLFPPNSLALITCFQTIEHVLDPAALCQEAFRLLKPGGALCLVAHNRRAWSARLLGRHSPIFDIEHMQLFSPASIGKLLSHAGFTRLKVGAFRNRYPISYWTRLFPLPSFVKTAALATLRISGIGRIQASLPAGNLVAFGFRS